MQDPQTTPYCVPTGTIAMLAMGCDDEAHDMIHISQCDRCSALLRDALEDLSRDPSIQELTLAESLPPPPKQIREAGLPRWPLAIAAALLVLVSASAYRLLTPQQHETLSAQLSNVYGAHRSMDLRLAGSEYSEVRIERSQSAKSPYAQIALVIAEGLEKNPGHTALLRDKGRLALLEGRYDEAISILESSDKAGTDLAAAYFQRGMQGSSREDLERAFSRYRAFADAHPYDVVPAFNLAVVAASTRPPAEARVFFEKYLALESSPEWKQEAQARMARLRVEQ